MSWACSRSLAEAQEHLGARLDAGFDFALLDIDVMDGKSFGLGGGSARAAHPVRLRLRLEAERAAGPLAACPLHPEALRGSDDRPRAAEPASRFSPPLRPVPRQR